MAHIDPLPIIKAISDSYSGAREIYTKGGCFRFHLILAAIFRQAVPMYSQLEGHVWTEIDGRLFDINGICWQPPADLFDLRTEPRMLAEAYNWAFKET